MKKEVKQQTVAQPTPKSATPKSVTPKSTTSKGATPKSATSKPTTKKPTTFWTEKKTASLLVWFEKMKTKEDRYAKIADKLGSTKGATYSKLRRMGIV